MWARALTAALASFGALASCGAKICELAFGSDSTNLGRASGHSLLPPKAAGLQSLPFAVTSFKHGTFGSNSTNFGRAFGYSLFSPKAAGLQSLPFAVTSFKKCWRLFGERFARALTAVLASFWGACFLRR